MEKSSPHVPLKPPYVLPIPSLPQLPCWTTTISNVVVDNIPIDIIKANIRIG